ncbi:MAG: DUF4349 domain-containing protein [Nocardioides sp.]|nr:DUF4349 domain-containing protein [Nocardioides sp.]
MTTRTRLAGILTAITMTAALAACSSTSSDGGSDASSGSEMSDQVAADAPEMAADAGAGGKAGSRSGAAESASSTGSASTVADLSATPSERAVISTGTVSLQSRDVAEARREVQRVVDAQGGDVTDENTETDDEGTTSYSRLVVRVPSATFNAAMLALEKAAELRASNRGAEDVTTQVIDTDVRVRAQQASLKRVELLLSRAQSLKDIIWIESQLTSRQAELDSMKSQQSWLRDQTTFSTITVDITAIKEKAKVEEKKEEAAGFLVGLQGGMKALTASTAALATVVGALLPFAILVLVLGFPVWLVLRRRRPAPAPLADV